MDGTHHIMCYVHDAVYRPFFRGMPPSTEYLLNFYSHFLNHGPGNRMKIHLAVFWCYLLR